MEQLEKEFLFDHLGQAFKEWNSNHPDDKFFLIEDEETGTGMYIWAKGNNYYYKLAE